MDTGPSGVIATFSFVFKHVESVNIYSLVIGLGGVVFLWGIKELNKRLCPKTTITEQLMLVVLAAMAVVHFDLQSPPYNLLVVGDVPEGVPRFSLPQYSSKLVLELLQGTIVLAIISYIISISMAKIFANKVLGKVGTRWCTK